MPMWGSTPPRTAILIGMIGATLVLGGCDHGPAQPGQAVSHRGTVNEGYGGGDGGSM